MNFNKRIDRMKQWAGEKMGGDVKTAASDEFKNMESEMNLRHEGMERLQKSMTGYVKSISKRSEGEEKDKLLPIGYLGQTMVSHGQDFNHDSEFGNCLIAMGRTNENLARKQEAYVAHATSTWLESLERNLAQMKEYQSARKKLEQRRLAYDASLAKMQKAKREDFRVEEELRSQKAKYEETSEDVLRRMEDIRDAEAETIQDLTAFLDSELAYYQNCTEMLQKLKRDWPASGSSASGYGTPPPRNGRSCSTTAHSFSDRLARLADDDEPQVEERARLPIPARIPSREHSSDRVSAASSRPAYPRANTGDAASMISGRDNSPAPRLSRVPTEPTALLVAGRPQQLRPVKPRAHDIFTDSPVDDDGDRSPGGYYGYNDRSDSPTSFGSLRSQSASFAEAGAVGSVKKAPPPPPPSRAKKPAPPPPPPMKRSTLSTSQVPHG